MRVTITVNGVCACRVMPSSFAFIINVCSYMFMYTKTNLFSLYKILFNLHLVPCIL